MSGIINLGVSALQASQAQLATTGHILLMWIRRGTAVNKPFWAL